jgi:hypothetical protein
MLTVGEGRTSRPGMRNILILAMLALIVSSGGCAATWAARGQSPSNDLRPLVTGWERFFTIDWQPGERNGKPIVSGWVVNTRGAAATRVQLLVEGLGAEGKVISQEVAWLGQDIPPFNRTYFELPAPRSPNSRVSVFAYDWRRGN